MKFEPDPMKVKQAVVWIILLLAFGLMVLKLARGQTVPSQAVRISDSGNNEPAVVSNALTVCNAAAGPCSALSPKTQPQPPVFPVRIVNSQGKEITITGGALPVCCSNCGVCTGSKP